MGKNSFWSLTMPAEGEDDDYFSVVAWRTEMMGRGELSRLFSLSPWWKQAGGLEDEHLAPQLQKRHCQAVFSSRGSVCPTR